MQLKINQKEKRFSKLLSLGSYSNVSDTPAQLDFTTFGTFPLTGARDF